MDIRLKKFNEMIDSFDKIELKNFGFLNSDILSTMIINGDEATLYLFNYGNYGRVRNYLSSISEEDFTDIEDWLSDRLRDENILVEPSISSLESIDKSEINDTDILSKYKDGEIGDLSIKIKINLKKV